jgi:hypothetical protein
MIPPALITMVAGWIQRRQQQVITYLLVEKRVLTAQRGGRRLRLTDPEHGGRSGVWEPHRVTIPTG